MRGPNSGSSGRPAAFTAVPWRSVWMPVMVNGKSRRFARSSRASARPTLPYPMSASFNARIVAQRRAQCYHFAMKSLFARMLLAGVRLFAARRPRVWKCSPSTWKAGKPRCSFRPAANRCWWIPAGRDSIRRDADRIAAAAKLGGVKKIDYLVITHFHADHVGGVQHLADKMPIVNFVDHGANTETDKAATVRFNEYSAFRDKGKHILVKPGDTIPIKGLDVKVLSSNGDLIASPLPGAGQPNPACDGLRATGGRHHRKFALRRHADYVRQLPHDRYGRPDQGQRLPACMPGEQDRPGGCVSGFAPWFRSIGFHALRAGAAAARGHHE